MRGAAPVSAGASDGARAADRGDHRPTPRPASSSTSDGDPGTTLDAAARRSTARPARRCRRYLDLVGYRLLDGFDICGRYALELPDALLRAIRVAVEQGAPEDDGRRGADRRRPRPGARGAPRRVRRAARRGAPHVPPPRRAGRLQRHLGVRASCAAPRSRPAAGSRPRAAIHDAEHFVDADFDEMCALVTGTDGPSADELAERFADRSSRTAKDAPADARAAAAPAARPVRPAAGGRPGHAGDGHRDGRAVRQLGGRARGEPAARSRGERGCVRRAGPARLRARPSSIASCRATCSSPSRRPRRSTSCCRCSARSSPTAGGLLSHSAIVAREYGIPGVVGTRDATDLHPDGARVRVDGDAGEVTVSDGRRSRSRPARAGARRARSSAPKATGLGEAARGRAADPARHRAVGRRSSTPSPAARSRRSRSSRARARPLAGPLAVRSSAADEDGADASFAGQHLTLLNVPSVDDVSAAVREIWWSANSDSAITYRQRVGLFTRPSVGVVVQSLLDPDCRRGDVHPEPDQRRRRADDRGELGARRGRRRRSGDPRHLPHRPRRRGARAHAGPQEDRDPRRSPTAAPSRRALAPSVAEQLCLDDDQLAELHQLATRCEEVYGPARDIEWAFAGGQLYLLQCRAVTRAGSSTRPAAARRSGARSRSSSACPSLRQHEPARRRAHRTRCSRSAASPRARPSPRKARAARRSS